MSRNAPLGELGREPPPDEQGALDSSYDDPEGTSESPFNRLFNSKLKDSVNLNQPNVHLSGANRVSSPSRSDSDEASVQLHIGGDDGQIGPVPHHPMSLGPGTVNEPETPWLPTNEASLGKELATRSTTRHSLSPQEARLKRPQGEPPPETGAPQDANTYPRAKQVKGVSQALYSSRHERGGSAIPRASKSDQRPSRVSKNRSQRNRRSQAEPASTTGADIKAVPSSNANNPSAGASQAVEDSPSRNNDQTKDIVPTILLQPETRPISHGQLVVEVRGIYAGLVMVEAKCIDVDEKQAIAAQDPETSLRTKLSSEQWRALIALHKTLLHEHHDFFLASQHPAASPMLSGLAEKYAMPARLWRHGIYGFLEVLRHRLPDSLDHMLAFIYIAYSMIALLYETALGFESTWIEALGDLSRYRMAVETEDMEVRQTWSNVSRSWYIKATDRNPAIGRLYHHLAILEKPYSIHQLSRFAVSLICITPFANTKTSIMSLFVPVLEGRSSVKSRADPVQFYFIKTHAIMCTGQRSEDLKDCVSALIEGGLISKSIAREHDKFKDLGAAMALANISAMLGYGQSTAEGHSLGVLRLLIEQHHADETSSKSRKAITSGAAQSSSIDLLTPEELALAKNKLAHAASFGFKTFSVALQQGPDKNTGPMIHIYLVLIRYLAIKAPRAMADVRDYIPWNDMVVYLNQLVRSAHIKPARIIRDSFPAADQGSQARPLMEDYSLRGLVFTTDYPPMSCFEHQDSNDEERLIEHASMDLWRVERMLWLAHKIASLRIWITFDERRMRFASTGFCTQLEAPELYLLAAPATSDTDEDSTMTEAGSERDFDAQTVDTASSRTISLHGDSTPTSSTLGANERRSRRASYRQQSQDVDMADVAVDPTHRGSETITEQWLASSARDLRAPSKFALQGIDPENYPIKIQDGGDEASKP